MSYTVNAIWIQLYLIIGQRDQNNHILVDSREKTDIVGIPISQSCGISSHPARSTHTQLALQTRNRDTDLPIASYNFHHNGTATFFSATLLEPSHHRTTRVLSERPSTVTCFSPDWQHPRGRPRRKLASNDWTRLVQLSGTSFFRYVTIRVFDRRSYRQTDRQTNRKALVIPCVALHAVARWK